MKSNIFARGAAIAACLTFGCADDGDDPSGSGGSASTSTTTGTGSSSSTTTATATGTTTGGQGGQGGQGGAGGTGQGGDGAGGGPSCDDFSVKVGDLRATSAERLEAFFDQPNAFNDGELWFNEGLSAHDGCPAYAPFDHTSVVYVSEIDPALVPVELGDRKVGVSWGLNGIPDIWFVPADPTVGNYFFNGRRPTSGILLLQSGISEMDQNAFYDALGDAHPTATLTNYAGLGMIVYEFGDGELDGNEPPGLYAEVLALLDDARNAPEVSLIEPDGFVFPIPQDFAAPVAIDLESSELLSPECLRDLTLPFVGKFVSAPLSFPEPFGSGWLDEPTPCQ